MRVSMATQTARALASSARERTCTYRHASLVPRPLPPFNVSACNIERWEWPGDEATGMHVYVTSTRIDLYA